MADVNSINATKPSGLPDGFLMQILGLNRIHRTGSFALSAADAFRAIGGFPDFDIERTGPLAGAAGRAGAFVDAKLDQRNGIEQSVDRSQAKIIFITFT